jgi:hypothetical protein
MLWGKNHAQCFGVKITHNALKCSVTQQAAEHLSKDALDGEESADLGRKGMRQIPADL